MATPKKVVAAFLPDSIKVGELEIRPFTAGTILFLDKINHPLTASGNKKVALSNAEVLTLVYVLSRPIQECLALLRHDPNAFEDAVLAMAEQIPPRALNDLGRAINQQFSASFSTHIPSGASGEKKTS